MIQEGKKLLLIFCLSFFTAAAFCQNITLFTKENPEIFTAFSIEGAFKKEVGTAPVIEEFQVSADFSQLNLDCGLAFQNGRLDSTARVFYMPTFQRENRQSRHAAGIGFVHHFLREYDSFSENDFQLSARYHWYKSSFFDMEVAPGIMWKISGIDSIKEYTPAIVNFCYLLEYQANFNCTPDLKLYFSIASIDYFEYPLFGTPFIKLGGSYRFADRLAFDASFAMKFTDGIVSALVLNQCKLKTTVKVYW